MISHNTEKCLNTIWSLIWKISNSGKKKIYQKPIMKMLWEIQFMWMRRLKYWRSTLEVDMDPDLRDIRSRFTDLNSISGIFSEADNVQK